MKETHLVNKYWKKVGQDFLLIPEGISGIAGGCFKCLENNGDQGGE